MPRKNIMREFRIDEISSVDRAAQESGERGIIIKRAPVKKALAVTTISNGHAHTISTYGPDGAEMRSGSTDYARSMGGESGHSHNWITDEVGNIIIADAAGHGHGLAALVTKSADIQPEEDPLADLLSKGETPAGEPSEEDTMTDEDKKKQADLEKSVADLTARAERAEKMAELSDAEKLHLQGLQGESAEAFLSKSAEERKSEIESLAKADAVIYKDLDGLEYRKSDDSRLVAMAKRADAERKAREEIEKKAADAELAKRADAFSHLPGESEDRIALMKGISLLTEEDQEKALKCLNASEEAMSKGFKTLGTSSAPEGSDDYDTAMSNLAKGLREKDPTLTEAQAMVKALETDEGRRIYAKQHQGLN